MYAEEKVEGHNELLTVMLSVMEPLVSYGFYWKPDEVVAIINFLIDILDGSSDRPSKGCSNSLTYLSHCLTHAHIIGANSTEVTTFQTKDRYKSNEKNRGIFKLKAK